jgi:hypothetical protein
MAYEKRDGDISVFQDKKKTNDKAPDWTGAALMDGIEYRVVFWQKSPTMLAGKIEIARKKQEEPRGGGGSTGFDDDTDIPFVSQWSIR